MALLICGLFSLAGILINVNRFWQYDLGYYDFGFFDKAIWSVSRFQLPITDHFIFSGKIIFADHFNPSIFLLTPLYWFTTRSEALLIAQSILVGLSGYILFLIGVKVLKNYFLSFSVLLSYFFFTGLQNAVYSDFHELTVMTFFLAMTYWCIINGRKKPFFLFLILTLGFKESLFLLGIGLSFFIYFFKKNWRKTAIICFFISAAWGLLSIKVIIPYFSQGLYNSSPILEGGIGDIAGRLITPSIKIKTVFWTMLSFLFLPLLAPSTWSILVLNYIHRFLMAGPTRWDLGLHYNAEIAPTLAMASILGLYLLQKRFSKKIISIIALTLILNGFILYRFIFHGPLGLAYHSAFYEHTKDFYFIDKMVKVVPKNAKVLAQNNLTLPFLHQDVWILRENYKIHNADYILIDIRDGQNPSNYLGINDLKKLFNTIKNDTNYKIIYHEGDQYVFKRKK